MRKRLLGEGGRSGEHLNVYGRKGQAGRAAPLSTLPTFTRSANGSRSGECVGPAAAVGPQGQRIFVMLLKLYGIITGHLWPPRRINTRHKVLVLTAFPHLSAAAWASGCSGVFIVLPAQGP